MVVLAYIWNPSYSNQSKKKKRNHMHVDPTLPLWVSLPKILYGEWSSSIAWTVEIPTFQCVGSRPHIMVKKCRDGKCAHRRLGCTREPNPKPRMLLLHTMSGFVSEIVKIPFPLSEKKKIKKKKEFLRDRVLPYHDGTAQSKISTVSITFSRARSQFSRRLSVTRNEIKAHWNFLVVN